jgi:RNA ligase (TIGR02306 family)
MRKLASIQTISSIEPIENADAIDKATVMGWTTVVKKNEFQTNDQIIFVEVDSILPDGAAWAEFMRSHKFRIRTAKIRGVISQGIIFPLSILPINKIMEIEEDVTEILGIKKYEPPLHNGGIKMGQASGGFPISLVPKTDETRIQSVLKVIEEIKNEPFYITTKCDGTSATYLYIDDKFCACSRNWQKREDETNIYWAIAKKYNLVEKLKKIGLAIQGEIIGPSIAKNKLMLQEVDLFCFNIYDIKNGKYLDYKDFINICNELNLKTVPIDLVKEDGFEDFDYSLLAWLDRAKGNYLNTNNPKEGIVVRPLKELYSKTLQGRLSFKVINNDFLLKHKE